MTHLPDFSRSVLDATSSLLFVTELGTGVVVEMNRTAETLTGFSRDQVVGSPLWDIASPAHRDMLKRALEDASGQSLPPTFESTVNLRTGHPRRVVWSSTFLENADGRRTHAVTTGIDISSAAASGGLFAHLMQAANTTPLISTDRRGRVTYCSSGAEKLLGVRGDDLVGRPLPLEMFDPSELRSRAAELQIAPDLAVLTFSPVDYGPTSSGELVQEKDWTLNLPDGRRIIASVAVSAARDARGVHVGYVAVAHDVTERRRANRALADALHKEEKAVERLHDLDRAKSEFVATVSHELRTPTTNIVGSTEMLLDGMAGELTALQRQLVETVERNSGRLVALADDLVTLARADDGDLDLELEVLDLRAVVSRSRDAVQTLLLDRCLETFVELPETPVLVRGDVAQLSRAVSNLLSNAVKFTDDGGRILCRLDQHEGQAVLEVADTGVGIPREEQRDLFTRFFRSSTSQARATQGSGLGLSVVASVVHQHSGTISVESEHLQGCTFTVRLPLVAGP